jgi:hypothetical protein
VFAQLLDRLLLRQGGEAGIGGVAVASRKGHRPECHQPIADELIDNAVAGVDERRHFRKVGVQQLDQASGGQQLAEAAEALDIGKEHGRDLPLGQVVAARWIDQIRDDARIDKLAESLLDAVLGDDGHWTRGRYDDGNGGHCLVGALLLLSRKHRLPRAPAIALLQDAVPKPGIPLVHFNDLLIFSTSSSEISSERRS